MITYLNNNGYHIDISSISADILKRTIDDLTVFPYKLDATEDDNKKSTFLLYKYSPDRLCLIVPRFYGIYKFGLPQETNFDSEEIDIKFEYTLREKQQNVVERCLKYMMKNGGGLLSVPCGFGKTICALYMASVIGLKTLIVVHKSNLLGQWIKAIKNSLNMSDDKIGIIRQKKCNVENKDIVVGMIQTISKKEYKDVFNKFGLVIYDEAHHVACKFFSKTLMKTCSQYMLALTATPYRGDGLIKVMYWFSGGTIYREKIKINKNVIVKVFNYKSNNKKLFAIKQRYIQGKVRPDVIKMTGNLCEINTRNKLIVNIITHIRRNDPSRKILILSDRISHLEELKKDVDLAISEDIENGIIDNDEIFSCHYNGTTKTKARTVVEERGDIIFATYFMASEGVSIDHLNTVILASPKKDVMQSIGRVMRTILGVGDVRPMIIDIADHVDCIKNWIKLRNLIYTQSKYEIENYYATDNKLITSMEFDGITLSPEDIHHSDMYINRIINDYNKDMNEHEDIMEKFRQICGDNTNVGKKIYKVLDELEYTDLSDILFVKTLTEQDIERTVVKDAENNDKLDLEQDIAYDKTEEENERSFIQALTVKKTGLQIPKKSMFR